MKKFELIHNRWIKKIAFKHISDEVLEQYEIIKISSISFILARTLRANGGKTYFISLKSEADSEIRLEYDTSEEKEFKDDLLFLESKLSWIGESII